MRSPLENILDRVEKPRQRQPGQFSARCPAHEDKDPSLSIRETPEGAVLLHCFAGCNVREIVGSMGLEVRDLFAPEEQPTGTPKRTPKFLTASQALDLLHDEAHLIAVCAGNIAYGVELTDADRKRVLKAAGRVNYLRGQFMGGAHAR